MSALTRPLFAFGILAVALPAFFEVRAIAQDRIPAPRADDNSTTNLGQREGFPRWLATLWPEARAVGVTRGTFEAAAKGLAPDLSLPDLVLPGQAPDEMKGQAEFIRSPSEYLSEKSFVRLSDQGRKLLADNRALLAKIEGAFGVSRYIILAIWGRESAFSSHRFTHNTLTVLATHAYLGRRKELFRSEFIMALSLLERGALRRTDMLSSWAGAMGPTQFMPSDYDKYAVDFDGDGKPNPWGSLPDALASAANQLLKNGWIAKRPWGYEVTAPEGVDCSLANPSVLRAVSEWSHLGFAPVRDTSPIQHLNEPASVLMPAGNYGPTFLTLQNFQAIKAYNQSELYAIFVGHLADRIKGAPPFAHAWDKVTQLKASQVAKIQARLAERGLYKDKIDGKVGSYTRSAIGAYQKATNLKIDCWPTIGVLAHMSGRAQPASPKK